MDTSSTAFRDANAERRRSAYRVTNPVIVHSRAEIAGILADQRRALGLTCEDLDARAGFSDRYTAKLEHGDAKQGRQGFQIIPPTDGREGRVTVSMMAEVWLESLGLSLVLMPTEQAEALGAVKAPPRADRREAA